MGIKKMSSTHYNTLYDDLVESDDDIMGIIAYAFYKKHKKDWIREFVSKNGNQPTREDLKNFFNIARVGSSLDGYRQQAKAVLNSYSNFLEEAYDERIEEIQEAYDDELIKELKEKKTHFWVGVSQNIIASILFVFMGAAMYVGITYLDKNPSKDIAEIIKP